MFTPKTRFALIALGISMISAIGAAGAASKPGLSAPTLQKEPISAARDVQVAPTGDGPANDAECAKYEKAINSWADHEVASTEAGNEREARKAKRNVEGLIADATDRGCFIIY
jgi:hypothetical protein